MGVMGPSLVSFSLNLLLLVGMVSAGITMTLLHKSHPNITDLFTPDQYKGYKAKIGSDSEYVIYFSVGTPRRKTYAVFDTGSGIIWLQSSLCRQCFRQDPNTAFDVARSSTFERLQCEDADCEKNAYASCETKQFADPKCLYGVIYYDGTKSGGYLGTDIFRFSDRGDMEVRLAIGVGLENTGIDTDRSWQMTIPGVFGMSLAASYQLTTRFGTTDFSYCISDNNLKPSYVKIGSEAEFWGPSIRLLDNTSYYEVPLTNISVNGEFLVNGGHTESWEGYPMIIDTGTPVSRLARHIMDAFKDKLEDLFDDDHTDIPGAHSFCWEKGGEANPESETVKNMTITFHFGDIPFELTQSQIWHMEYPEFGGRVVPMYCFNFIEATKMGERQSILGTMQSTNKNIAIDIELREISIEDRVC